MMRRHPKIEIFFVAALTAAPVVAQVQQSLPEAWVISATGLGTGGSAQTGNVCGTGTMGICRVYLFTGSNPAASGTLMFYDSTQPAGQASVCVVSKVAGDPRYLGTPPRYKVGHWPRATDFELDYWIEYPTTILNWVIDPGELAAGRGMQPFRQYALDFVCPPRHNNHNYQDLPEQGQGAAPIGGPLPPQ